MDILFYNGSIIALGESGAVYQAIGVANGRIAALGTGEDLRRWAGTGT